MAGMRRTLQRLIGGNATRAAIPIFLGTIALEYLSLRRRPTVQLDSDTTASNVELPVGYETRDAATSIAMGLGSLIVNGFAGHLLTPLDTQVFRHSRFSLGTRRSGFALAVLAWDFLYYWDHRWSHERRVLWASHVNHHSSERYNLSTALRQSWTGFVVHWVFMPMLLVGFPPRQVARAGELNLLYQYWVHTEIIDRLPDSMESVLNSASHHRVHHGTNPQYLDRNYAGILIIWDRLFGTFEPEGERVHYGLTKNIKTFNPAKVAFHEWRALWNDLATASSWRDRAGYLLGPPGWTPSITTKPAVVSET